MGLYVQFKGQLLGHRSFLLYKLFCRPLARLGNKLI